MSASASAMARSSRTSARGHHALLVQVRGEALRARQGPVDDVHPADAGPHQMRGRQRAHRSGADHRCGATGQPGQPGAGHVERHRHHRGARGVDTRLAVHALADRQRALREFVQGAPDGVIGLGGGIGAAHLAQDLLFTDHRGVQARGDGEQVLDGGLGVADVGVLGQIAHRHAGVLRQHLADHRQAAVERLDDRVNLDAVAGGQHHRLGHQRRLQHCVDDLGLIGLIGGQLLEDGDRRAAVRDPEKQDTHGARSLAATGDDIQRKPTTTVAVYLGGLQISQVVHRPPVRAARSRRNRGSSISQ